MKKSTSVIFWHYSIAALIISLCYFAGTFIKKWDLSYLIPFLGFSLIFIVLYGISYKPLKMENGCTLIQAIGYYKACKRKGFKEGCSDKERKILTAVAEDMEILTASDISEKLKLYKQGKDIAENIKDPFILFLWEMQDRFDKQKTEKERKRKK